ncbi:hypothetical protein AXE65_12720 [Ventosimonas gracilis]|uniref:Rha family transcriptional regulator n=1 Tax=Ventosimonas gracilis TaxID=1680762 RepID=A0A139SVM8_9GAMM|nr:Rha family transcriptional regulator [Ventosimonas gracilis]KXU38638.1 hypothetical protein AXE65_12720 [Ventosimonas gracilis]
MTNPVNVPQLAHSIHPSVQLIEGRAVTSSTEVARVYGKQHKNVLAAIEKLIPDLPVSGRLNFQPTTIQVEITGATNANGATRESKAYHLTRDGFTLLAMGFTGKKALAFKLAYIEAFNQMEAALTGKALPPPAPTKTLTFTIPLHEHHSARWLLDVDHQGNERCRRLSQDTRVLTRDRLVSMFMQNPADLNMTLEERLSILGALLRALGQSARLSAHQLGINPAKPPQLPANDVASL